MAHLNSISSVASLVWPNLAQNGVSGWGCPDTPRKPRNDWNPFVLVLYAKLSYFKLKCHPVDGKTKLACSEGKDATDGCFCTLKTHRHCSGGVNGLVNWTRFARGCAYALLNSWWLWEKSDFAKPIPINASEVQIEQNGSLWRSRARNFTFRKAQKSRS